MPINAFFRLLVVSFLLKATLLLPTAAWAGLHFNNRTNATITMAIGYNSGGQWLSKGWFKIVPGATITPIGGNLDQKFYYYYAYSKGRDWTGKHNFCIHETNIFTDLTRSPCSGSGYKTKGFIELNTENATDYAVDLTPEVEITLDGDIYCAGDCNNTYSKYYHKQEKDNWCWAACIQMVLHKQTGYQYEQCTIAKIALKTDNCPNIGADGYVISSGSRDWPVDGGRIASQLNLSPTFDNLTDDLIYGYPVIIAYRPLTFLFTNQDHASVLTGIKYRKEGDNRIPYKVIFYNPLIGQTEETYWSEFKKNLLYTVHVNFRDE